MYQWKRSKESVWWAVFILLAVVAGVVAIGSIYYKRQKEDSAEWVKKELIAIADLKVKQIDAWRRERLADGYTIADNHIIAREVEKFLASPDGVGKEDIQLWLSSLCTNYGYHSIVMVDVNEKALLSVGETRTEIGEHAFSVLRDVFNSGKIFLSDFHRAQPVDVVHLDMDVPLTLAGPDGRHRNVGALVMRISPDFLNSFLQLWPTRSKSAETLLVRRDGDSVVFLNELRHKKIVPIDYRLPLAMKELPAVKAVLGEANSFAAVDYRGVPVFFTSRKVPDSPWYLVAKIDQAEVLNPLKKGGWLIMLAGLGIVIVGVLLLLEWWHSQLVRFYRRQYEVEVDRKIIAQRYDYILKNANDIIAVADSEKRIVEVNDRAIGAYGYTREEFQGMNIRYLRAPEYRDKLESDVEIEQARAGTVYETVHVRKNGEEFPVEVSLRLIEVAGQPFYQGIIRDISERKKAEQARRESEERFRMMFDQGMLGVVLNDSDGRFLRVNQAFCRLTGYEEKELLSKSFVDITHPDHGMRDIEAVKKVARGELPYYRTEKRYIRKDGKVVWGSVIASLIRDQTGKALYILAMIEDITERKKAEQALIESENRYSELFDRMTSGVAIYEPSEDGHVFIIRDINKGCEKILNVSKKDVIGRRVEDAFPGVKDFGLFDVFKRVWQSGVPEQLPAAIYKDQRLEAWYENFVYKLPSGEIVAVFDDVTERKRHSDELLKTNTELSGALEKVKRMQESIIIQERLSALGQMVSGITHDFNNVLMPILGLSDFLLSNPSIMDDKNAATSLIRNISKASKDAAAMVKRLRNFYHPDEDLVVVPVDADKLCSDVIAMTEPRRAQSQAEGCVIRMKKDMGNLQIVMANETQIREVLINLVLNAIDAMPRGGTIEINGSASEDGAHSRIAVRDTGEGMTEDVKRQCMDPFFTTKGSKGTGMGLAMAHGIVLRHGGTIEIESEVGKGTTVTVTLPVEMPQAVEEQKANAMPPVLRSLNILVVDDESGARELLQTYLSNDGHTVCTAENGQRGIEEFGRNRFDLVLTDKAMPDISGDEVAKAIKALSPEVPVIQLTGFGDLMKLRGERPECVDQVLEKPITQRDLREAISSVMGWGGQAGASGDKNQPLLF